MVREVSRGAPDGREGSVVSLGGPEGVGRPTIRAGKSWEALPLVLDGSVCPP